MWFEQLRQQQQLLCVLHLIQAAVECFVRGGLTSDGARSCVVPARLAAVDVVLKLRAEDRHGAWTNRRWLISTWCRRSTPGVVAAPIRRAEVAHVSPAGVGVGTLPMRESDSYSAAGAWRKWQCAALLAVTADLPLRVHRRRGPGSAWRGARVVRAHFCRVAYTAPAADSASGGWRQPDAGRGQAIKGGVPLRRASPRRSRRTCSCAANM